MQIIEVTTPALSNEFIEFQPRLYKDDSEYIRPWDHEIKEVFTEGKNKFYRQGKAVRWLLHDASGKTIGRIAAFTHPKFERKTEPCGGCGFFDCINDQQAANLLFDTAKNWLISQGKTMMDGPINFGEKDKWWGVLVEGFDPPLYGMNYNAPYYKKLFENYGFQDYYQQYIYRYSLNKPAPARFKIAFDKYLKGNEDYTFIHANKKQLDKFAEDFRIVYNEAWGKAHQGFKPMRKEQTKKIMQTLKPIMIKEAMIFAYYKERPIGIFISIPNLNEIIKHLNGKFSLWHKLKFMYHLKIAKSYETLSAIIFGIVPEFQGKAVDAGLALKGEELLVNTGKYNYMELMWIGDFNPKMVNIVTQLETKRQNLHATP